MPPVDTAAPDFTTLVRDWSPSLRRYLQHQTGDAQVAEDLLQETLLKTAHGLADFGGRSSLKTWLYAIASNTVADHLRRTLRDREFVDLAAAADLANDEAPVEDRLEFDAMNHCVREVIDALSPVDRAAILLHDIEGLDCVQTAEALGVSSGAARVRIHRARERLAAALGRRCSFYRDSENTLRCERAS